MKSKTFFIGVARFLGTVAFVNTRKSVWPENSDRYNGNYGWHACGVACLRGDVCTSRAAKSSRSAAASQSGRDEAYEDDFEVPDCIHFFAPLLSDALMSRQSCRMKSAKFQCTPFSRLSAG